MEDIHTIATGVFLGGLLLAMFLISCRRMVGIEDHEIPWWAYVGTLGPLAYMLSNVYLSL